VKFRKVIQRSIREVRDGVSVAAEVNATVAGNVDEQGGRTSATSRDARDARRTGGKDRPGSPEPREDERSTDG
jgi:hypothetical protein